MIISPPFLPPRAAGQSEEDWLASAMRQPDARLADTDAPEGSFPLSHALSWHGGVHLQAPRVDGVALPVRAVADGVVVFAAAPRRRNDDPADPQNYDGCGDGNPGRATWTDNGCVIVRHHTAIGSRRVAAPGGGAAREVETELVFYSAYLHLSALARVTPPGAAAPRPLRAGDAVWRKDEIGRPGRIYDHDGQIHFEIALDDENLQRLVGRRPAGVDPDLPVAAPPSADGRVDSVFGDLYVHVPAGAAVASGSRMPADPLRPRHPAETLPAPVWVRIGYERGACSVQALDAAGTALGPALVEPDGEYRLYEDACARHAAVPAHRQAQSSPSGWFELLRFGRNIGRGPGRDEQDPLPDDAAHWRRVALDDRRRVWLDLNAPGSFKFSDADFLPLAGWNFVDDDSSPDDQRCDSARLKRLIRDPDPRNARRMEPAELARRLGDADVQRGLRRVFCRFPCEWDRSTIAARYGFVRELPGFRRDPGAWGRFEAHLRALTYEGLPDEYLRAKWRPHSVEFVRCMRRCRWLTVSEMLQLVPAMIIRKPGRHDSIGSAYWEVPDIGAARRSMQVLRIPLNGALRKFGVDTPSRQACFFGNAVQETSWFACLSEAWGRRPGLHSGWYGRGFLQLTNPNGLLAGGYNNYYRYFRFLGREPVIPPGAREIAWRDEVAADGHHAAHSAGVYWVWSGKSGPTVARPGMPVVGNANELADCGAINERRTIATDQGVKVWYYNQSFANCAAAVNLPTAVGKSPPGMMNGLVDRSVAYVNALVVLDDVPTFPDGDGVPHSLPEGFTRRAL